MVNIATRITDTQNRLESLRSLRATAVLDGADYDAGEYAAAEQELAALHDAQGEETRRARDATASARRKRQAQLRDLVVELERERIQAITDAEEFARSYVAATRRAMEVSARLSLAIHELTGKAISPLSSLNVENRLSLRLSVVLKLLKKAGPNRRFGFIDLPNTLEKPETVWAVEEAKQTESTIQEIRA